MPAFDALLMFRTTGNFTKTESSHVKVNHIGLKGMTARFTVRTSGGTTTTINLKYYGSNTALAGSWHLFAQHPPVTFGKLAGGDIMTPIITDYIYIRELREVTGSVAASNFGACQSGLVSGPVNDWVRS